MYQPKERKVWSSRSVFAALTHRLKNAFYVIESMILMGSLLESQHTAICVCNPYCQPSTPPEQRRVCHDLFQGISCFPRFFIFLHFSSFFFIFLRFSSFFFVFLRFSLIILRQVQQLQCTGEMATFTPTPSAFWRETLFETQRQVFRLRR